MASSRRTYDTDVITLRTVFAKNPGNSNIPGLRVLTADGQGGTYWAIPSTLGLNPSFNQIVTTAGTYTADLSFNTFRLLAGENIGMANGDPGSNTTYLYAKAFSEIDISGENSLYAFRSNVLDPSLSIAGQNGITLRGDPATNTLFIVGPASNAYTLSTGIYGFNQIKVTEAASTITPDVLGWDGTYITATSPSTLVRYIGYNDIQLSTNVTTNSIYFTISTFTSKGYLDISATAYGAYPSTMSTVSSLYTPLDVFNSTIAYFSSTTGFSFSSVVSSIDALAMSTGANFYLLTGLINARVTIAQFNDTISDVYTDMTSTSVGLGTLGYISTGAGGVIGSSQLASTVTGLGTAGYISSAASGDITKVNLLSTVEGLGSAGYVSSTQLTSTVAGLGSASYVSSSQLLSSVAGLGSIGYISSSQLASTLATLGTTFVSTPSLLSTVRGLGSAQYVSTSQLTSTVRGLGTAGYLSSPQAFSYSTGNVFASSLNLLDVYTNAVNFFTVSSGSLLVNGAYVGGGTGGGGGAVAQIVAGCNISVTPVGGTGVVTVANTGPTITTINDAISSFSTAFYIPPFNFSTISTSYASSFVVANLTVSTMNTATIVPSSSNVWVAVGYGATASNSIQFSGDGSNWSNSTSGGFSLAGKSVAYNGSLWVAVGNNGGASGSIQYSLDGQTWVNASSGGFSGGGTGVAWNGSLWIAVGNNGGSALTSIQTSRDGRSWSGVTSGGFPVTGEGIAWNGSYWVATGQTGVAVQSIQYSLDGVNWVFASTGGFSVAGRGVAWNGHLWVAVGDDATRAASIQYSGDGRNWSNVTTGGFISAGTKVAWNGRVWVAVGDDNVSAKSIQYSTDGSNWSDATTGGFSGDGYGIAWNGSYWIAAGTGASAVESLQRSLDGTVWTNTSSGGFATGGVGVAFSSNLTPGYSQQNMTILSQNIPLFLTSTNQILAQPSSLVLNTTFLVDGQVKRVGINCNSPGVDLDVGGTGRFQTLSTQSFFLSSINGANYTQILPSTVRGLGQIYISTPTTSTVNLSAGRIVVSSLIANNLSSLGLFVSSINGLPFGVPGYPSTVSTNYARSFNTSSLIASSISQINVPPFAYNLWLTLGVPTPGFPGEALKTSPDGINWTNSGITLFTYSGYGLAYNGSRWVAVGDETTRAGTIRTSTDGVNWVTATTGGFGNDTFVVYTGYAVAWNGRMWVAVGNGDTAGQRIQYSYDGLNWNTTTGDGFSDEGRGVAWNGRLWVAVGVDSTANGSIKTSFNGITWTNAVSGGFDNLSGRGVAWNGQIWVAVGDDTSAFGKVKTSVDGSNWTNAESGDFSSPGAGTSVAWNGMLWVATFYDNDSIAARTIQYSSDGKNWSPSLSGGFTQQGLSVAWNGKLWVAVGITGDIQYSFDGKSWSNSGTAYWGNATAVAYSSNTVFPYRQPTLDILPQAIPLFYRSTNQILALESSIVLNNTLLVDGVRNRVGVKAFDPQAEFEVFGEGRFRTLSTIGVTTSSINGMEVFPTMFPSTVAGLGQTYVSTLSLVSTVEGLGQTYVSTLSLVSTVEGLGSIYLSTPTTSTLALSTGSLYASSISFVNIAPSNSNLWVAVGTDATQSGTIKYSTDGLTWVNSLGTGFSGTGKAVAWNGSLWIAVGSDSTRCIKYSVDGINWYDTTGGQDFLVTGSGVAWNGSLWVAVGTNTSGINNIKYSTDGLFWNNLTGNPFTTGGNGVAWNGRLWVAVGQDSTQANTIKYSYDGSNWSNSSGSGFTTAGNGVAWNGRIWVAVGQDSTQDNTIKYSGDGITWSNSLGPGFDTAGYGLAWNGRMWVAVGDDTTTDNRIKYSFDGSNWFNSTSGSGFNGPGYGVAWNGSYWIGVGDSLDNIRYSTDGMSWTQANTSFTTAGYGIAYSSNTRPAYSQLALDILPESIPLFHRSTNQIFLQPSTLTINTTVEIDGGNKLLDVFGTGRFQTLSTLALNASSIQTNSIYNTDGISTYSLTIFGPTTLINQGSTILEGPIYFGGPMTFASSIGGIATVSTQALNLSSINGANFATILPSTVAGLGRSYVSTPSLVSTVRGLGQTYTSSLVNVPILSTLTLNVSSINGALPGSGSGNGSSITVSTGAVFTSSLTFGSGNGWVSMGALQAVIVSSIQLNSAIGYVSSLYCGSTNALRFPGYTLHVNGNALMSSLETNAVVGRTLSTLALNISSINGTVYSAGGGGGGSGNGSSLTVSTSYVMTSTISQVVVPSYTSNLWIAVGADFPASNIRYSLTGLSWSNAAGDIFAGGVGRGVAYNGRLWVAVGTDTNNSNIKYSLDGFTWTTANGTHFLQGYGVAWNGRYWLATGTPNGDASIKYSFDGVNWSNEASGGFGATCYAVAWSGRMWVAVGEGTNKIKYSFNGSNWLNGSGGFSSYGSGVAWGGTQWVAVGADATLANRVKYSGDGSNWSNSGSGVPINFDEGTCVAWNGNRWVVGGYTSSLDPSQILLYSANGTAWTPRSSGGFNQQVRGVAWNGSLWIITGVNSVGTQGMQYSSDNGLNWVAITSNQFPEGNGVAYSSNVFPSYTQETLDIYSYQVQNPLYVRSTNQIVAYTSSLMINNTLLVDLVSQRVGIGCNNPAYTLDVNGTINAFTAVKSNGTNLTSDRRIKQFITTADLDICYSNVKSLPLRRFEFIDSFKVTKFDGKQVGFVADEVEQYYPKAVNLFSTNVGGFSTIKHLNYDQIFFANFGATKKLMEIVEGQDSTIKGQAFALQTMYGQFSSVLSTLEGLQGR